MTKKILTFTTFLALVLCTGRTYVAQWDNPLPVPNPPQIPVPLPQPDPGPLV